MPELEHLRILCQMKMRTFLSLLLIFAFACSTRAQSKPQSSAADRTITQQSGSNSETYSDTLAMVKAWSETEESDELGRMFAVGDLRTSDLLTVCNDADEEIASFAFHVLQLLGKSECLPCGETISRKHNDVPFMCEANIADANFNRIERWLAKKKNGSGYECAPEGEYEPLTPMDDSVVYALILDGSPRSRSILNRMDAIENACGVDHNTIIGEILEQAQSLIKNWLSTWRSKLRPWRNGLALSSMVLPSLVWVTSLVSVSRLVVSRVSVNPQFSDPFFHVDALSVFATLLYSNLLARLLAIALKGKSRLLVTSAVLLLWASLESSIYF